MKAITALFFKVMGPANYVSATWIMCFIDLVSCEKWQSTTRKCQRLFIKFILSFFCFWINFHAGVTCFSLNISAIYNNHCVLSFCSHESVFVPALRLLQAFDLIKAIKHIHIYKLITYWLFQASRVITELFGWKQLRSMWYFREISKAKPCYSLNHIY